MRPEGPFRRTVIAVVATLWIVLVVGPAFAQENAGQSTVDSLGAAIDSLRVRARYSEAAELAGTILAHLKADPSVKPYQRADAERLIGTLRFAAALPESSRRELAEADGLTAEIGRAYGGGMYAEGERYAKRQLEVRRRLLGEEHQEVARALDDLAVLLLASGDYSAAGQLSQESLAIRRRLLGEEHPEVSQNLNNLAVVLEARGDYAGAEPLVRESLAIARKLLGGENPAIVQYMNNLAAVLDARGDYAAAEPLYRESLARCRKLLGEEDPFVATSLNNLAQLLHERGDYAGAEPLYREALVMRRNVLGEKHPDMAKSLSNLGLLLQDRGDYAGAEPLLRESLAMTRRLLGEEHPEVATILNNLAALLRDRGDHAGAEQLYRESLAMARKSGEENPLEAASLNNLAGVLEDRGDYAGAEPLYRESLAAWRRLVGEEHPRVASVLGNLARLLQTRGDYAGAESLLAETATTFEAARLRAGSGMERVTFLKASPYPALAATRLVLHKESEAWPAVERSQGRGLADLLLTAESRDLSPTESHHEDSLRLALGDRERQLWAYREAAHADSSSEARNREEEARNHLLESEARWSAFEQAIAAQHPVTEGQSYDLARVQASLRPEDAIVGWLDASWGPKEHPIRRAWAYVVRNAGPVSWEQLPVSAEPTLAGLYRAAFTTAGREKATTGPGRSSTGRARQDDLGRQLFRQRVAPLLPHLDGVRNLIVIPSGEMLGIPVEAIPLKNGRPLGESFAVSYTPSATIYTWLHDKRAQEQREGAEVSVALHAWGDSTALLLLGDPPFNKAQRNEMERERELAQQRPSWTLAELPSSPADSALERSATAGNIETLDRLPRLPWTRTEVTRLAQLTPRAVTLLGPDASEQRLVELARSGELKRFRAIHLATHAYVDPKRPEQSCLLLSRVDLPDPLEAAEKGERICDGLLTVKEILQEWRLNADLVTLSGCETALGQSVAGEGYIGFAHAFLQAGARSVVVSLWRVEDEATALLMRRFYSNLFGGENGAEGGRGRADGTVMTKRQALREAKEWLRTYKDDGGQHPYADPYYWAPFVLIGDPD